MGRCSLFLTARSTTFIDPITTILARELDSHGTSLATVEAVCAGGYGISFERNYGFVFRGLTLNPPANALANIYAGTPLYHHRHCHGEHGTFRG